MKLLTGMPTQISLKFLKGFYQNPSHLSHLSYLSFYLL